MESLIVLGTVFLASICTRKILGLPIFRPRHIKPIYEKTWLTGYPAFSEGFLWVAQNCMWVHVTTDKVSIHPHFPICVFMVPELLGMGWEFDKKDIIGYRKTTLGVRVKYKGLFCEREFVIYVGDKNKFIEAINA
jgi:hypothetical protein